MQSKPSSALWVDAIDGTSVDLTKCPRIEVVRDSNQKYLPLYAVVAYTRYGQDSPFEILFQSSSISATEIFHEELMQLLNNAPIVH